MNENITLAIVGIGLGLFGAAVWYAEMFTDSKAANLWRRMNGKGALHNWGCSWGLNPPVSRSARVM